MIAFIARAFPDTPAHRAGIPYGLLSIGGSLASVSLFVIAAGSAATPLAIAALTISGCVLATFSAALFKATTNAVREHAHSLVLDRAKFNRDIFRGTGFIITQTLANAGSRFAQSIVREVASKIAKAIVGNLLSSFSRQS